MQPSPAAADLLAIVAEVLSTDAVPALSGPAQHRVRVAASLVQIIERELRLGADAAQREQASLSQLFGMADHDSLESVRHHAAQALRSGFADDPRAEASVWTALMAAVRDDLAIAKPGHDNWTGD
jgi:hypothetical protein